MNGESDLLSAYDAEFPRYEAFAHKVKGLIEEVAGEYEYGVHSVTCRVKSRESFARKVTSKEYADFSDITDICGVRIITYFEEDVDAIAYLVEREFEIDRKNSVDKRALLESDRFGYLSLHLVALLNPSRSGLIEYQRFKGLKVEIQIRSILQHAWAEIEHDLGYKTELGVPKKVRRRFSRLAGLLEMADQEFSGIRSELRAYEDSVTDRIEKNPQEVGIDKTSLSAFIEAGSVIRGLESRVEKEIGVTFDVDIDDRFIEGQVAQLSRLGVATIGQLEDALERNWQVVFGLIRESERGARGGSYWRGISLIYLTTAIALQSGYTKERLVKFIENGYGIDEDDAEKIAELLVRAYVKVGKDVIQ